MSLRQPYLAALLAVLLLTAATSTARAQTLQRASELVRGTSASDDDKSDSERKPTRARSRADSRGGERRHRGRHHHGAQEQDDGLMAWLALRVITAPWWLVREATEQGSPRPLVIADHPYAHRAPGYLQPDSLSPVGGTPRQQPVALHLSLDGSYLLADLTRFTGSARLLLPMRLELDVSYASLLERNADGALEQALLGRGHLSFRFAQSRKVQFRTGIGYQHWRDTQGSVFGFDLHYGFDLFWGAPLVTSVDLGLGSVGLALSARARCTLGVVMGPLEGFLGYEHVGLFAGQVNGGHTTRLGGPLLGLRAWI